MPRFSTITSQDVISVKKKKKRKLSSQKWLNRNSKDKFVKAAKAEGYYSRSAYKLIEVNNKFKLLQPNMKVIDLGAAPGGWSQVVSETLKPKVSTLVSVDLLPIKHINNCDQIIGDFTDESILEEIDSIMKGALFDLILSDLAPNSTGIKDLDHMKIMHLITYVLDFMQVHLKKGGSLVVKIFQGSLEKQTVIELKNQFGSVQYFKPNSSRKESNEIYLIAKGFKQTNLARTSR